MALALAFNEAKAKQVGRAEGGSSGKGIIHTRFFGSRSAPDLPDARLSERKPGETSGIHFHIVDQFQVFVGGKGKLGRHEINPYCLHFSRAYTPYGPFSSDANTALTYLVLRPHFDPGAQMLPDALDKLKQVPDRQPWQITCPFEIPALRSGESTLETIPGIRDDHGLAGYVLKMRANAQISAPDPSNGDGQYLLVIKGSLLHDNREHKAYALVFVYPQEGPLQVRAGADGLEALVLNFPRHQSVAIRTHRGAQPSAGLKTWKCALCEFVYDEAAGMPEDGIAPGTPWQDVPETWSCPDCSACKADFQMIEL